MTHGSPELDEDAAKLIALGLDPGPELKDFVPLRQVACEACGGEGKTWHGNLGGNDPDEYSRPCFACGGDGWYVEEVEPDEDRP